MKNSTRRIVLLTVLAAALGLMALRDRPSEDRAPIAAPRQAPAVVQDKPAVAEPEPVKPRAIARVPVPIPVRDDPKQVPVPENNQEVTKGLIAPPEPTPVAALGSDAGKSAGTGAPDVKPAGEKPDSLFGWGPWAGAQPGAATGANTGAPSPPQDGVPSVQGINATVSAAGSTPPAATSPPPAVVPLPVIDGPNRGGHGWGDRHHHHHHRRDR